MAYGGGDGLFVDIGVNVDAFEADMLAAEAKAQQFAASVQQAAPAAASAIASMSTQAQAMLAQLAAGFQAAGAAASAAVSGSGGGGLDGFGSSMVLRTAEGVLLRDAVREVVSGLRDMVEFLPSTIEKSIAMGDSLYTMALKTGTSVEFLSKMKFVAGETGADFDTLSTALTFMEKNLSGVGATSKKATEILHSLGLEPNLLRASKPEDAYLAIMEAIEKVGNQSVKAGDMLAIFGRGGKEWMGLANDNIVELNKQADALGLTMSGTFASSAHVAEVEWKALNLRFDMMGVGITTAFLPAVMSLLDNVGTGLTAAAQSAGGAFSGLGGFIGTVVTAMGNSKEATAAQTKLYDDLKAALIFVARASEGLVTATGYIGAGFKAVEVIFEGAAQGINYIVLGYEKATLAVAKFNNATTFFAPELTAIYQDQITQSTAMIAQLEKEIAARSKSIDKDMADGTQYLAFATDANKTIEAGIAAITAATMAKGDAVDAAQAKIDLASAAHVHDIEEVDKALTASWAKYTATTAKIYDEAFIAEAALNKKGLDAKIATLEAKEAAEIRIARETASEVEVESGLLETRLDAIDEKYAALKAQRTQDDQKAQEGKWAELEKVTDEYYKVVNAASHDSVARQIDDAYLAAAAKIAAMEKSKNYSVEAEMVIWKAAEQTANNIIQKTLESDVHSKAHFEKIADDARIAYEFALAHATQYTSAWIIQLQKTADAAKLAADTFGMSFDTALNTVDAHITKTIDGFHQLAMASASATIGPGDGVPDSMEKRLKMLADQQAAHPGVFINPIGLFSGLPGHAAGIENNPVGHWAMVGEHGPEAMYVPQGASIYANGSGAGGVTNIYVTAPVGSDPAAFARAIDNALTMRQRNIGARSPGGRV